MRYVLGTLLAVLLVACVLVAKAVLFVIMLGVQVIACVLGWVALIGVLLYSLTIRTDD